jgi:type III secretion protein L
MVIWLRSTDDPASRIGVDSDIVRHEMFGHAVALDDAYVQLEQDRQQVLQLAEEQAASVVEKAARDARRMREEAQNLYDSAARRGFDAGQQAALEDWHRRNLDAMTDARALQARMRERLAELITSAVEQIVLVAEPQALFQRALKTLDTISDGATYLRVSVSLGEYDDAVRTFAQLLEAGGRRLAIEVMPDKRLSPGACVCESDYGVIDASLDTQLNAIRSAIGRALKHSLAEPGAVLPQAGEVASVRGSDEDSGDPDCDVGNVAEGAFPADDSEYADDEYSADEDDDGKYADDEDMDDDEYADEYGDSEYDDLYGTDESDEDEEAGSGHRAASREPRHERHADHEGHEGQRP